MSFKITVDPTKLAEKKAAEAEANRKAAYIAEADPLFFRAQRGEIPEQEWLDKIAEIKARYPKE
jgi:predicted NBD/HSP70 family sugar kinase